MSSSKKTKTSLANTTLSAWFNEFADRVLTGIDEGELAMSESALTNVSQIMSADGAAMFPKPLEQLARGKFGRKELASQMNTMCQRRHFEVPADRASKPLISHATRHWEIHCAQICWKRGEICEWIWDVIAKFVNVKMLSLLPHDVNLRLGRSWKTGMFGSELKYLHTGIGWPEH
eukprot:12418517-Karenia_brevis.AAC.1